MGGLRYMARNLRVYLRSRRMAPLDSINVESHIEFNVRLGDIDYNLHMNNSKFLEAFEMGRFAHLARIRTPPHAVSKCPDAKPVSLLPHMLRHRWMPIVASAHVIFLAPLRARDRYVVHTRIDGWDDRWMFIVQRIEIPRTNKVAAIKLCKATIRDGRRPVHPREIAELVFRGAPVPAKQTPTFAATDTPEAPHVMDEPADSTVGAAFSADGSTEWHVPTTVVPPEYAEWLTTEDRFRRHYLEKCR
eukprot:TRINITY_DN1117_c0_g1_i1.p1 TRINITY_DN1117_c0_g1~~TRINITY_DN1117_c0_g1_i1.p1  ORF type:complete len:266 (+),score=24.71 TRINITY_DN1117_c0_g1_i1:62-799(+)